MTLEDRIPVIPMLPIKSRYTEEWYDELLCHDKYLVLGWPNRQDFVDAPYNYFTNLEAAIQYESNQIALMLYALWDDVDKLLLCDLDFPGLTAAALPAMRLKFPRLKLYAILHAGTWINGDIFEFDQTKAMQSATAIRSCERVFVATRYHLKKIETYYDTVFSNICVLGGLPFYAKKVRMWAEGIEHHNNILVVGRPEQTDFKSVEGNGWDFHTIQLPRKEFIRKLASYKAVVIPKVDETFGMTALEAAAVGTVPLVPNSFSYFEIMPSEFTYEDIGDLKQKATKAVRARNTFPFHKIDLDHYANLFDRIAEIINHA